MLVKIPGWRPVVSPPSTGQNMLYVLGPRPSIGSRRCMVVKLTLKVPQKIPQDGYKNLVLGNGLMASVSTSSWCFNNNLDQNFSKLGLRTQVPADAMNADLSSESLAYSGHEQIGDKVCKFYRHLRICSPPGERPPIQQISSRG